MSIEKKCVDCSIIIVDEWFFACKGFLCDNVLGFNCAARNSKKQLSKFSSDVKKCMKLLFDGVPGLSWFCSECLIRLKELHSYSFKRVEMGVEAQINAVPTTSKTVEDLSVTRSQTKNLDIQPIIPPPCSDTILTAKPNHLPSHIDSLTTSDTINDKVILPNARESNSSTTTANNDASLWPIAPFTASSMLPPCSDSLFTANPNHLPSHLDSLTTSDTIYDKVIQPNSEDIKVVAPRRWLFVSRIDKSISNQQFENFIKLKMKLDKAVCINISPNRVNDQVYDYTSFRISLPEDQFQNALLSTNWPNGLLVKEFQWRPRNHRNFRNVAVDRICQ